MTLRQRRGRTKTKTKTQLRTYSSLVTWKSLISTGSSVRCKCICMAQTTRNRTKESLIYEGLFCYSFRKTYLYLRISNKLFGTIIIIITDFGFFI